jgi:membrane protein implicated in regulation of membrane protease activity
MAILIAVLLSIPGAWLTNHLLRDRLDPERIALAVGAGSAVGALVIVLAGLALLPWNGGGISFAERLIALGGWQLVLFSVFGGPVATAVAVWRWRPRRLGDGDLRA